MILRVAPLLFLLLALCSCGTERSIDEFVGTWQSPPFSEMMDDALSEEVIPAIRAGKMPEFEEMRSENPEEYEEFLNKSDAQLKEELSKSAFSWGKIDFRFGVTITSDSRFVYSVIVNGEETIGEDRKVSYEVSEREILIRTDDETEIIYIEEDHLRMRNEKKGKFPKFIRLYRVDAYSTPE